jgi:hypothetical protein
MTDGHSGDMERFPFFVLKAHLSVYSVNQGNEWYMHFRPRARRDIAFYCYCKFVIILMNYIL